MCQRPICSLRRAEVEESTRCCVLGIVSILYQDVHWSPCCGWQLGSASSRHSKDWRVRHLYRVLWRRHGHWSSHEADRYSRVLIQVLALFLCTSCEFRRITLAIGHLHSQLLLGCHFSPTTHHETQGHSIVDFSLIPFFFPWSGVYRPRPFVRSHERKAFAEG